MSDVTKRLEEQATLLFNNVSGWQTNALKRIGRRIKNIKSLSYADLQALNNATIAKQDIDAVLKELSELTNQSIPEVRRIYSEMIEQQHEENRQLYDYRNKPFVPFADNKSLQAIVRAYARTTADTMIKLSMTKAKQLGFADRNGNFVPIEKNFIQVLDKAVMSVATGTGDFGSEMRDVLKELGGSGLRIDYGGGVTRRLDTMVRQNLLWGAKQASVEYNEMISEELGCDGIEIDWHSFPRPSHEFMQGKQYSLNGRKTISGITYESADDALAALSDYGCLHFKTPIILGVSEPRFSSEELARLNEENKHTFEINGKQLTGYEAKQVMRRLETEVRKTKDQINILKASGDNTGAQQLRHKVSTLAGKYQKIAQITGIKAQPEKMTVVKAKYVDNATKSGIINKNTKTTHEEPYMHTVGTLDKEKYKLVSPNIINDEVIITNNRIEHIKERRGEEFFEKYSTYFGDIISDPDYIFSDSNENTAIACKTIFENGESINIVVRLVVEGEDPTYKNSIITAIKENKKRFSQRLRNNTPVYTKKT